MGRAKRNQRDGFTPRGAGPRLNDEFSRQDVPPFVAKHRNPPYLNRRVVKNQKGPEGGEA